MMKHLIDAREPITCQDIDEAIRDSRAWLQTCVGATSAGLIQRLLAIVEYTYGPPPAAER